jgi:hypothetical protein
MTMSSGRWWCAVARCVLAGMRQKPRGGCGTRGRNVAAAARAALQQSALLLVAAARAAQVAARSALLPAAPLSALLPALAWVVVQAVALDSVRPRDGNFVVAGPTNIPRGTSLLSSSSKTCSSRRRK